MTSTVIFKGIGVAVLVAATLQGCSPMNPPKPPTSPPPALDDTAWTLASLPGTALPAAPRPTLQFENGRAAGSDGCNRYGTGFKAADGKLELGPQRMSTQMACPPPQQQLAQAFNRVLDEVRGYRIEAGSLLLLNAGGATLATLAAQPSTLAGTAWQVTGVNNGKQAVVSVIIGTELTLQFGADGKLQGNGGCNRFNGSFSEDGKALRIDRLAGTRMACPEPEGRMAQEAQLLAALESVARARRDGDKLELRTATGAMAVSARLAPPAKP
jgi:heat shock protein HslJ